ncbi:MAG: hypothetical protein M3165_10870 [Actinomycetota bacterium]|nr:hypothetical protein [Actinomycetota bacterium]
MTPEPDEEFRRRAIRAVLAVVGIAVALGLVVGGLAAGAVYMSGVIPASQPSPTLPEDDDDEELPTPSLSPTSTPSPTRTPSPTASAAPTPTKTATPTPKPTPTRSRRPRPDNAISLRASTSDASSFEQVTLSGTYPGGNGTTLEVQRREGGSWASFPTSATVDGGQFSTYVASGQPGPNAFRVVDPSTGQTSNVVVFTVS